MQQLQITANDRPDEYGADETTECSYDDEGQNLKPVPLMMKCDFKHDQLSVLKRVDSLQSSVNQPLEPVLSRDS